MGKDDCPKSCAMSSLSKRNTALLACGRLLWGGVRTGLRAGVWLQGFVGRSLGDPGLKPSVRVGEAAMREVAAFLLDHEHFASVPHTVMVKVGPRTSPLLEGLQAAMTKHSSLY